MLMLSEDVSNFIWQHPTVDTRLRSEFLSLGIVVEDFDDLLRRNVSKRFDRIRARSLGECRADFLRGCELVFVFLQVRHRLKERSAFADRAMKQTFCQRRSDERVDAPGAG